MKPSLILCAALTLPSLAVAQQTGDTTSAAQPTASSTPGVIPAPPATPSTNTASADSAKARVVRTLRTKGINPAIAEYWRLRDQDSTSTPESLLNDLGYDLLKQSRVEDAIRAFRANIAAYPD